MLAFTADGAAVMVKFGTDSPAEYQGCYAHALHLAVCDILYKGDYGDFDSADVTIGAGVSASDIEPDDEQDDEDEDSTLDIVNVDEDQPMVLQDNIADVISNVRKDVKFFRKSPKSNELLQNNVKCDFKHELKLILDVKTRWNSLYDMLQRYVKLRSCVVKTFIDIAKSSAVSDADFDICKQLVQVLEPVQLTSDAFCRRDANLLTADAATVFLLETLEKETKENNVFSPHLYNALKSRITKRRNCDVVNLMRYLKNEDIKKPDPVTGLKIVKSSLQVKATELIERLYPCDPPVPPSPPSPTPPQTEEPPKQQPTMKERLNKIVEESTQERIVPTVSFSLSPEFKLFESTRKRTEKLDLLYQALLTIKPTSVESERAFSLGGSFCTKVRSKMNASTLSALVTLKLYFKSQH